MEEEENAGAPSKSGKVSLSLPKDHFNYSVDNDELNKALKTYSVKNMAINNKWALKNFEHWFNERRKLLSVEERR